jgi:putative methyltransferase (TIGR04325 family)
VKSAKAKELETNELTFQDSLSNLPPIDFIYSSGAIQYTPEPYLCLESLLKINANYILFNRTMFNENDRDIITVHTTLLSENGHGRLPMNYIDKKVSYPHTTMSFRKFNSMISEFYKLRWMFEETSGSHKVGKETIIGRGLYFSQLSD